MSTITISFHSPLLPEGCRLNAEIAINKVTEGIAATREAVTYVFEEATRSSGLTPAERNMTERLNKIDQALLNQLPADVKLAIANRTSGT